MPRYDDEQQEARNDFWGNWEPNQHGLKEIWALEGIDPTNYTYWEGHAAMAKQQFDTIFTKMNHCMKNGGGVESLGFDRDIMRLYELLIKINSCLANIHDERKGFSERGRCQTFYGKGEQSLPKDLRR
jgi:hypothetical protein